VLTAENVAEYVMIEEALHSSPRGGRGDGKPKRDSMTLGDAVPRGGT
jgi:hypothetical protein